MKWIAIIVVGVLSGVALWAVLSRGPRGSGDEVPQKLSPEARAVKAALSRYGVANGIELGTLLGGLRAALHLAANERVGLYPSNRHGSGDHEHAGKVFATDALAVEGLALQPAGPGTFSSDAILIERVLTATSHPTDPQVHLDLDLARSLAAGGVEEGQRIRLPFVQSAPAVFARAFDEADVFARAGRLSGLEPEQLEAALNLAVVTEARRFVKRRHLMAPRLELLAGRTIVAEVTDPVNEISVAEASAFDSDGKAVAGAVIVEAVEIEQEWPSFAKPLLELIDAANARRLGSFTFGDLVARRKLDAMPRAPEALLAKLRPFGISAAWRLFNADGPEVYRIIVPSRDAFGLWRKLSEAAVTLGHHPVVLGSDQQVEGLETAWTDRIESHADRPAAEHHRNLKRGEKATWIGLASERFVTKSPREVLDHVARLDAKKLLNGEDSAYDDLEVPHGEWPAAPIEEETASGLVAGEWTHLALVPAKEPWEVPAWLTFFSGEAYPHQSELVAVAKDYHRRYGARVFGMSSEAEVELWVPEPLKSRDDALAVATEHFFWCPDVVEPSVEHHAARLLKANLWKFWWD